ncbi:methyl-accepting chemotaxis sensory transducer with Pas/Pac sensor [Marinobacter persicus]|uniref:Methyl-accepting chemotaxis sensory transducer with Pas/Pac sensor n=1 Tax=Marinobacter persicus TaxID=930118 RepID=A0A1I3R9P1_9GAMM|nr:PAS domain-containing methyl-accepting chemotaxis protein [Marinobacter persicus]GHD43872.1 methyl-accepting chemotaxis protein [Marinobacter persicus]SFJ43323.1 methyl-accepting chemotaxis sensory transducer with Pas/Pac sensor [Marinobacter persicus]
MSGYESIQMEKQTKQQLLVLTDSQGRITYASKGFCQLVGYSEAQLKEHSFEKLRHPDMPKGPLNDLWKTLGRHESWMGMIRNKTADGKDLWLDAFVTPISDTSGSIIEYQAIYQLPSPLTIQRTQDVYRARGRGKTPRQLKIPLLPPALLQTLIAALAFVPALIASYLFSPLITTLTFLAGSGAMLAALWVLNRPLERLAAQARELVHHPIKQLVYTGHPGLIGQIELALRLARVRLDVMITRVSDSGQQTEGFVMRANTLLQSGTQASGEQQAALSTVATSVEEFSATLQEVSSNTQQAATLSNSNRQAGDDATTHANAAQKSIQELAQELDHSMEVVRKLDDSSQSIGRILDVIVAIAEQTNLLALNAAIEAARAGESGRGFAVVADEVRSLARRTQQSTDEIQDMITTLQEGSRAVVASIETGKQQSNQSVEQMQASVEALQTVVSGLNDNDGLNQQIAAATEQQSQTVQQISEEVADIHRLASDTAQTLTETVQAGESVGYHVLRQKYLVQHLAPDTRAAG